MSLKTIRCRLVAPEATRKAIWNLMAEYNTPLINEALRQIPNHPDFPKWKKRGKLPDVAVKVLIDALKREPRFEGQPVWYYISAQKQVTYIFRSWLSLQNRKQWRLEGQRRWLNILTPDSKLANKAECSIEELRTIATRILNENTSLTLFKDLLRQYSSTQNTRHQCAIAYLLKRGAKLDPEIEDLTKLEKRQRKTKIRVERLEAQIQASIPSGRDLTGGTQEEALNQITWSTPTDNESYNIWKDAVTTEPTDFPFPITYETVESLIWSKDSKDCFLVRFQGKGTGQYTFKIYCDKPHYHWFERFLVDQETKKTSGDNHSAGLFTLRTAKLSWIPSKKHEHEREPWNRYYLSLACTVDTRLWTQEGTQVVIQNKAAKTETKLQSMYTKDSLTKSQQGYIRRLESTLHKLETPYPRPSQASYHGNADILIGVSMGLDKPATVAVVNALTGEVITYRSVRQLLGTNYRLLRKARAEKTKIDHKGHRQRKKGNKRMSDESDLGKHIDRLLAKAIVNVAQEFQAGSIVLPNLANIDEMIEAEVKTRAEERVPDYVDGQREYAKAYRVQVHRWSYRRLQDAITSKAEQFGISVETSKQEYSGTHQEKAKNLVFLGYANRLAALAENE